MTTTSEGDEVRVTTKPSRFSRGLAAIGPTPESAIAVEAIDPLQARSNRKSTIADARIGKVSISGYYDPAVRKQLARLGIDAEKSQQELLAEALNLLFEANKLPPIARG